MTMIIIIDQKQKTTICSDDAATVHGREGRKPVGGSRRVENLDFKVRSLKPTIPKPIRSYVQLSAVLLMAEAPERLSPIIVSRFGSIHTSLQTSVIRLAIKSLTLLRGNHLLARQGMFI